MANTKTEHEKIEKIGELIGDVEIAMLTTVDEDGTLRSRPMAYQQHKSGFDGSLYFFTNANTPKVGEIETDHRVNVSFSNPNKQDYVSIAGLARLSRDKALIEELWNPSLEAWFPKGKEDPDIALLVVAAEGAEYWDSPTSPVAHLFGFVKAKVTGETPKVGDNEKVALNTVGG